MERRSCTTRSKSISVTEVTWAEMLCDMSMCSIVRRRTRFISSTRSFSRTTTFGIRISSVAPWIGTRMTPGGPDTTGAATGATAPAVDSASGATRGAAAGSGVGAAFRVSRNERTSSRVTRPPIPVPATWAMSTSCSAAIFLTSGVERVLSRSSRVAGPDPSPSRASATASVAVAGSGGAGAATG